MTAAAGTAGNTVVEDNSHAGQGAVAVDIGGDHGALVIHTPAGLEGVEIEIRPTGHTPYADGTAGGHAHPEGEHEHPHGHDHEHGQPKLLHVAVLRRPSSTAHVRYAAVFGSLHEGTYELYRRPAEPVALQVTVVGGVVTEAHWPADR